MEILEPRSGAYHDCDSECCDSHAITTRVGVPLKAKHENEGVRQKALETGATKRGVQLEWGGVHTARLLAARQAIEMRRL